jgi:hypothetical protein
MKTTKRTWTIKIETVAGIVRTVRFAGKGLNLAESMSDAVSECCSEYSVANVLEVRDGNKVRWM